MKRILLASALVFALARPALVGADPGIFATAEIASFGQLQQDVTALGTAIGQPMLPMGLLGAGQLLASPGMLGIDRDKPIRIALYGDSDALAGDEPPQVQFVIALPLADADGASYFQSVLTSATKKSEADGFLTFDLSNSPLGDSLGVVVANGYAFLSPNGKLPEAELRAVAAQGADALAVPGLRGTVRIAAPAAPFAGQIRKGIAGLFDTMDAPADDEDAKAAVASVRADIEYLASLFEQNDRFALGLDFAAGRGLSIWSRTDAQAGSDAAALVASFRAPENGVLSVLGGEGVAAEFAGAIDPALLRRFVGGETRLVSLFLKAAEKDADDEAATKALDGVKTLLALIEKAAGQTEFMTGSFAEAVRTDDEGVPSYRFAFGCSDADAFRAASKELREGLKGVEGLSFLGMEDLDSREAGGLVVNRVRMTYDFDKLLSTMGVDPNAPLPPPVAGQMQLMRAMYGKLNGATMESAVRDGIAYAALAPGEAPLDAVLASLPAGESPAGQLPVLFADVPELGASALRGYVNYAKFVPAMVKTLPPEFVDPEEAEFKAVMEKILATPDIIGAVTWRDGDSLLSVLRLDENVFRDFATWGEFMSAKFRRQWEERMRQQQAEEDDEDDDDDDPLADLSEEDRKKIGVILDNNGDFDDNK